MIKWDSVSAEEYCIKVVDGTHDSPKQVEVGKYLITSRHITNGSLCLEKAYMISESDFEKISRRSKVDKWDVLITMIGTVGDVLLIDFIPDFAIKNLGLFKCGNELKAKWLTYYLKSKPGKEQIKLLLNGSTQEYISLQDLRNLRIPIADEITMSAVVGVLSSLDDKIDLLHRQNKTLESLAETMFRQWFVEEAKEDWEVGILDDEFEFVMGQSPSGDNINEDGKGMIFFQGRSDFGFRFPIPRVSTSSPSRIARKFDTLVSVRAPVGDINMAFDECCIGRGVAAFRYERNNNNYSYTYYKLRSMMTQVRQFEDSGTVFGSIGKDDFKKISTVIPPANLIDKFENTVKNIDIKIYANANQIQYLSSLRDTILPKLMSGEVRVSI